MAAIHLGRLRQERDFEFIWNMAAGNLACGRKCQIRICHITGMPQYAYLMTF